MDQLVAAIRRANNPSVVGLDPSPQHMPRQLIDQAVTRTNELLAHRDLHPDDPYPEVQTAIQQHWSHYLAGAYLRFNLAVLAGLADIVPAVKVQIAMYEALGLEGINAYITTCKAAQEQGLYVIGDVKRGDIGSTAAAYACHLSGLPLTYAQACGQGRDESQMSLWHENAVTVNPYLGTDGIEPFIQAAQESDSDLFVLVRTSNPSSSQIQALSLTDSGQPLYQRVGELVKEWGQSSIGHSGYSRVGAVVGATHPQAGARLRQALPETFFLLPGYGAQGARPADVAAMFTADGQGAIVNSSRAIIAAWRQDPAYSASLSLNASLQLVSSAARRAAQQMKEELNRALSEAQ